MPSAAPAKKSRSKPSAANIQLMTLASAFWTSRCVHTIAELGVADHLGDEPQSTESLAKATGTNSSALYRVLRLLASVGVFEWKHSAWHHTAASRLLRANETGSLRDYLCMMGLQSFWSACGDLKHSLRTEEPAFTKQHSEGIFAYLARHPEESRLFDSAMTSKSHRDIAAILPAYDFSRFASIADIAGGRGHLLRAILKSAPQTQGILFDQPHVVKAVAPARGEKLSVMGGDFFADPMPKADAYLLMNIIHDWPDAESIKILSGIRHAMPQHATVLVIEAVVPQTPGPHLSKELDIVMMAIPGGKERTKEEYAQLGSKCGLKLKRVIETHSPNSILEMVKQ